MNTIAKCIFSEMGLMMTTGAYNCYNIPCQVYAWVQLKMGVTHTHWRTSFKIYKTIVWKIYKTNLKCVSC